MRTTIGQELKALYEAPRDLPHEMTTILVHLNRAETYEDKRAATEQVRNSLDADKETGSFKHIVPFCSRRTNRAQARVVFAFVIGSLLAHPASLNRSAFASNRARKISASSGSSKQ